MCVCVCILFDNNNIVLVHLARAADALEHTEENDNPGSQEAQGQLPPNRTRVMKAFAVHHTQHTLTTTHKSNTDIQHQHTCYCYSIITVITHLLTK